MIYDGPQEAAKEQHTIEKLEKTQYFELVQFWIELVIGNQFNLVPTTYIQVSTNSPKFDQHYNFFSFSKFKS